MVTSDTEMIIGLHVEGFLAQAVKDIPESIELLNYAELRGITPTEVWALQRDELGAPQRLDARRHGALGRSMYERRKQAIASFIDAERSLWPLPFVPAIS